MVNLKSTVCLNSNRGDKCTTHSQVKAKYECLGQKSLAPNIKPIQKNPTKISKQLLVQLADIL